MAAKFLRRHGRGFQLPHFEAEPLAVPGAPEEALQTYRVKKKEALNRGSEMLSEAFVLSVAIAVAAYEYDKSTRARAAASARAEAVERRRVEAVERRLAALERALLTTPRPRPWWRSWTRD
mmetsp:Transcript_23199/g.69490  ORF Transcript_23199/g.69490 Transcript_23199/m.69490 type:complete len:121 (+) Transcript_23199:128-490(+)